ncbi:MAG: glycerophosphodiester phosphodiesterase family protein, partial [Hungatella sp.]
MRTMVKETYQMLKLNLKNVLIFELFYRLITGSIYLQLLNYGIRFSLKMAGYSYLTLENLGAFLLKPRTILTIFFLALIGLLIMLVEIGSLITAYSGAAYSMHIGPMELLFGGIHNLMDEIRRKNAALVGIALIDVTLINFYFCYRILNHVKPLDFILKVMLEKMWVCVLLLVLLILFIVIAIPTIFTFHGCMIEQKSFRDSVNRSMDLLKGRMVRTVFELIFSQVILTGMLILVYLLGTLLVAVFVVLFVDKKLEFAFLMEAGNRIEWVILFCAGIASGVVHFAAVTVQYYQYDCRMNHEERWDFHYSETVPVSKKNAVILLAAVGAVSGFCLFDTAYNGNFISNSVTMQTEITAHRGSSKTAPENTMAALTAAVEELADRAEIDVQETLDGQVVLCHDTTLKRVSGVDKKVADLSGEELRQLDVGAWFSDQFIGESIPTLDEVMEYAKGKITLNIEIKNLGSASALPEKVLQLVEDHEMQDQCVITSTSLNYLKRIKEQQPEIKTGYIISAAYGNYYSNDAIDFISIRSGFITDRLIRDAHQSGKTVHAWTVNSKSELERLKALG